MDDIEKTWDKLLHTLQDDDSRLYLIARAMYLDGDSRAVEIQRMAATHSAQTREKVDSAFDLRLNTIEDAP